MLHKTHDGRTAKHKLNKEKNCFNRYGRYNSHKQGRMLRILLAVSLSVVMAFTLAACSDESTAGGTSLPADGELAIHFIDVGQADCTLLVSQNEAMLIDAGNRDDSQLILDYLDELGIDSLKYIVFTHPHEDHIGSGQTIISNIEVEKIFMLDEYDSGIAGSLKQAIESENIATEAPEALDTVVFGECSIEFLGPLNDYIDPNDDSICLKVTHGENKILFTGDAERDPERDMIEAGMDLETDLFQAGHHGSSTSNSYYFLRESNPKYVVISCGENNMYGHPHEEALSRFNDLGAEIFRTDTQGTIIAVSDGEDFTFNVEGKKADKSYTEEPEEANYIGNINSKKYHSPECRSLPEEQNRVYFMTTEAAEKAGYTPCGNCRP